MSILIQTPPDASEPKTYPEHTYGTGAPLTRRDVDACRNTMDRLGDVGDFCYSGKRLGAWINDDIVDLAVCRDEETARLLARMLNSHQAFLQRTRVPLGGVSDKDEG